MDQRADGWRNYKLLKMTGVLFAVVGFLVFFAGGAGLLSPLAPRHAEARLEAAAITNKTLSLPSGTYTLEWESRHPSRDTTFDWTVRINVTNEAGIRVFDQTFGWREQVTCTSDGCNNEILRAVAVVGLPGGTYTFEVSILAWASSSGRYVDSASLLIVDAQAVTSASSLLALGGLAIMAASIASYKFVSIRERSGGSWLRTVAAESAARPRVVDAKTPQDANDEKVLGGP